MGTVFRLDAFYTRITFSAIAARFWLSTSEYGPGHRLFDVCNASHLPMSNGPHIPRMDRRKWCFGTLRHPQDTV